MNTEKVTYGAGLGAIILTALSMGIDTTFEQKAKEILEKNGKISPILMPVIETEAFRVKDLILASGRGLEADKKAKAVLDSYFKDASL